MELKKEEQEKEQQPSRESSGTSDKELKPTEKLKGMAIDKVIIDEPKPEKTPAEVIAEKLTFGSVIALFDKTPELKDEKSAFCPHFMELKFANGCHYDCQWCYLLGTFGRWQKDNDYTDPRRTVLKGRAYMPKVKPDAEITKHLEEALDTIDTPMLFNSGELSDSLVHPATMLDTILPLFNKYKDKGHKLLILTKSDDTMLYKRGIKLQAQEYTIVSHSINASWVAGAWELGTPTPLQRLAASRAASELGYETRLRLDPMVPVNNWKKGYRKIIEEIMRINSRATVITLGTPRGLPGTIKVGKKLGKDMRWTEYLTDNSSWGKKIPADKRIEMYSFAINELKRLNYQGDISLCKETLEVWDALKKNGTIDWYPGERLCNCVMEVPGKPEYYLKRTFIPLEIEEKKEEKQ